MAQLRMREILGEAPTKTVPPNPERPVERPGQLRAASSKRPID